MVGIIWDCRNNSHSVDTTLKGAIISLLRMKGFTLSTLSRQFTNRPYGNFPRDFFGIITW